MDARYDIGPGKVQQIVVAFEVTGMGLEPFAPEVSLIGFVSLDHGSHGSSSTEFFVFSRLVREVKEVVIKSVFRLFQGLV
jgi:hypothetical protein